MEILKGYTDSVIFVVPSEVLNVTFKVYKGDTIIGGTRNAIVSNGTAKAVMPYAAVQEEGELRIVATFTHESVTYNPEKVVEVVTPYLELYEVKQLIDTEDDEEAKKAESGVRHIINSHCGQTFGRFSGKVSVTGSGEGYLKLPFRSMKLMKVNNNGFIAGALTVRGGGWFISYRNHFGPPPVRADFDGWNELNPGYIVPPGAQEYGKFLSDREYVLEGEWGWRDVPASVREAAKLLVNDYACGDSLYRDRFLTSMTAADWRIQFHSRAFEDTGNVRANQLLSEYVMSPAWVVI